MERLKLATVWLGGCSGCHMSFLDLDEFLLDLAERRRYRLLARDRRQDLSSKQSTLSWSKAPLRTKITSR